MLVIIASDVQIVRMFWQRCVRCKYTSLTSRQSGEQLSHTWAGEIILGMKIPRVSIYLGEKNPDIVKMIMYYSHLQRQEVRTAAFCSSRENATKAENLL